MSRAGPIVDAPLGLMFGAHNSRATCTAFVEWGVSRARIPANFPQRPAAQTSQPALSLSKLAALPSAACVGTISVCASELGQAGDFKGP